jgi:chromosomal replication initiation ATPase DnaA
MHFKEPMLTPEQMFVNRLILTNEKLDFNNMYHVKKQKLIYSKLMIKGKYNPRLIEHLCCIATGHKLSSLRIDTRQKEIREPRQLAMWYLRKNTKLKYREIGELFNKDHATAIHSEKTINNYIKIKDKIVLKQIKKLHNLVDMYQQYL